MCMKLGMLYTTCSLHHLSNIMKSCISSIHRLFIKRILRIRLVTRLNVIFFVAVLLTIWYSTLQTNPTRQQTGARSSNSVVFPRALNHSGQCKSKDPMPAMVVHPGVHVVTSGTENVETGETVIVYFFWCGERVFRFRNYISVLSAVYIIKPSKMVFMHTHDMIEDDHQYNTWFQKLLETVPNLITLNIGSRYECNTDISDTLFGLFPHNDESSIFLGSNTIMTNFPVSLRRNNVPLGSARTGKDDGFLYVPRLQKGNVSIIQQCVSKSDFDPKNGDICLVLDKDLVPKDIWTLDTHFGTFARSLVYGHPKLIKPHQDSNNLTPRIAHFFRFGSQHFSYGNYLSVLSALYVAGLERVFFHGDKPQSYLFDMLLEQENVTHIHMPELKYIHNHRLKYTTHNADIGKLYVLSQYGGVTQDGDVFWTRRITDDLLSYDAVVSFDWPEHGEFPEVFNLGILIGKRNSFYFKALLNAMRDYRDDTVYHLAMRLPYKTYEQYPSSLHTERHLQVLCWVGKCHPSWMPNYIQPLSGDTPGMAFDWERDTYSVHCTWPKPPKEMEDFENLQTAKGLYANIGRNILRKAGKL